MMSKEETEKMHARWMAEEFDDGLACIASIEDDEE